MPNIKSKILIILFFSLFVGSDGIWCVNPETDGRDELLCVIAMNWLVELDYSKSRSRIYLVPAENGWVAGDLYADGKIDLRDLAMLSEHW